MSVTKRLHHTARCSRHRSPIVVFCPNAARASTKSTVRSSHGFANHITTMGNQGLTSNKDKRQQRHRNGNREVTAVHLAGMCLAQAHTEIRRLVRRARAHLQGE